MTITPASYTLETLGFDPSWRGAAIRAAFTIGGTLEDFTLARVSAVHRTRCELLTCEQSELVKLSAPLRPVENDYGEEEYPVVGDWVLTQPIPGTGSDSQPAEHKPLAILPRRSYLTRPSATRESSDQPVAANVDMLCIVEPCFPEPSIGRIERYTALAHASGVQVALILTKGDLVTAEQLAGYQESLGSGVDAVLTVCTDNGYDPAPVAELVAGRTAAFLGRSGAGKSTLVNALLNPGIDPREDSSEHQVQATSAVRDADGKGRHTTTSRQMIVLPGDADSGAESSAGTVLIDTPGVRALAATSDSAAIDETFDDVSSYASSCRYSDCSHGSEPGCAVQQALADGSLDPERFERYRRMMAESARLRLRSQEREYRQSNRAFTKANKAGRRTLMSIKGRAN
ncbi:MULTISPECIES: ribosome small subunit-dependent GTPase A [unclassified Rothia (in: high G+C Gram-positive bacteria)]|uniref:ribosome small subunit-dependent GTPase A n=1 Tax=unclassified Rothia (in: high G+C Gram-positive bacteria) TaxID=2689056 RepID=UPI0008A554A1|nr:MULTISPECIES: ribosome small subunit-dependent GTPase A [unclassified Rothia (in: high G+C Gram-positive bacteria)]OFR46383.1 ribosome small subunit-dependent GTPase [Rothia sp. HMSC073B08]OHQ15840.1 ribosome small subunit-dependent GTPase [Rothia sp. HMSC064F07]